MQQKPIIATYNRNHCALDDVGITAHDRAFLFGDAIYEVVRIYGGKPFLLDLHKKRLSASLEAVGIDDIGDPTDAIMDNVKLNEIAEGMVYLQVSRGALPPRMHSFFGLDMRPNVLIYSKPFWEHPSAAEAATGMRAITHEDIRWARCNIKSTNLLANCLMQTAAHKGGCHEAILIRDGWVTEGTTCNVFLVKDGIFHTPPLSNFILPGTRRAFLIEALRAANYEVLERPIQQHELFLADEIFITSSIKEVVAVVLLDGKQIGDGQVSPYAKIARALMETHARH